MPRRADIAAATLLVLLAVTSLGLRWHHELAVQRDEYETALRRREQTRLEIETLLREYHPEVSTGRACPLPGWEESAKDLAHLKRADDPAQEQKK